jgi:hypothetical protein
MTSLTRDHNGLPRITLTKHNIAVTVCECPHGVWLEVLSQTYLHIIFREKGSLHISTRTTYMSKIKLKTSDPNAKKESGK